MFYMYACHTCIYTYKPHNQSVSNYSHVQVEGVRDLMNTINVTHIATLRMVTEVLTKVCGLLCIWERLMQVYNYIDRCP